MADQGLFDEAIKHYRQADELWATARSPDRKIALVNWADALHSKQLFLEAAQKWRKAIEVDPEDPDSYNGLGPALEAQEQWDGAIQQYRKADALWAKANSPDRKLALVNWADALRSKKLYGEAAEKYREAIQVDSKYAASYNGLGVALKAQEHFDEAIEQYRRADELWGGQLARPEICADQLGHTLRSKKLYDEAAQKYTEVTEFDHEYANPYNGRGLVLAAQERFDEAIEQYRRADELWAKANSTDRKFALCNWADALRSKKLYEEAEQKSREAIEADPEYPGAYYILGCRWRHKSISTRRSNNIGGPTSCGRRPTRPIANLPCVTGPTRCARRSSTRRPSRSPARPSRPIRNTPSAHNILGLTLAAQEHFDKAIEQYQRADELWARGELDRPEICCMELCRRTLELERFDETIDKYQQAMKLDPKDAWGFFYYGNGLGACWRYREAIVQLEHAAFLAPEHPYHHHNKADFLFQLGRYEEGWKEWCVARDCYESVLRQGLRSGEDLQTAIYFADVLRELFSEYEESERYYRRVIEIRKDEASAWTGLAILYQQWAAAEKAPPDIRPRLSYAIYRAKELRKRIGQSDQFATLLSLADLDIETRNWPEARDSLDLAAAFCAGSRLKRSRVDTRLGLVCYGSEEYLDAIKHCRRALQVNPGDLTLRSNLGKALLRSKQFSAAHDEFAQVLESASGNIDALLGAAEVCISLADDGDRDQYRMAELHLTHAIQHGRNRESGSRRLRSSEVANIYYLRGYAQTKRFETEPPRTAPLVLLGALRDFRRCKAEDRRHPKAPDAIQKITRRLRTGTRRGACSSIGPARRFRGRCVCIPVRTIGILLPGNRHPRRILAAGEKRGNRRQDLYRADFWRVAVHDRRSLPAKSTQAQGPRDRVGKGLDRPGLRAIHSRHQPLRIAYPLSRRRRMGQNGAAIVPQDEVADPAILPPSEPFLGRIRPQQVE